MNHQGYFVFQYQNVKKLIFVGLCLTFLIGFNTACASEMISSDISKISMTRTPCYGKCSQYTVTFYKNGTAEYKGDANVERVGIFDGTISNEDFQELSNLIKSSYFLKLEKEYSAAFDLPGVIVEATISGMVKRVQADSQAIPPALEKITQAIDGIVSKIKWERSLKLSTE